MYYDANPIIIMNLLHLQVLEKPEDIWADFFFLEMEFWTIVYI